MRNEPTNGAPQANALPRLISVATLARAWDTTEATARRWARERNIPAVKVGKEWRFSVDDLRALVERGK
jgi:excisionase family DNA binding protein